MSSAGTPRRSTPPFLLTIIALGALALAQFALSRQSTQTAPDKPQNIPIPRPSGMATGGIQDRKSTRLNSSHVSISYAVFCLKKKNTEERHRIGKSSSQLRVTRRLHTDSLADYVSENDFVDVLAVNFRALHRFDKSKRTQFDG